MWVCVWGGVLFRTGLGLWRMVVIPSFSGRRNIVAIIVAAHTHTHIPERQGIGSTHRDMHMHG